MGAIIDTLNKRNVELKSEQVNLGLVEDFLKKVTQGETSSSAATGSLIKAKKQLENAIAIFEKSISMSDDLKTKAKELGVDITKNKSYVNRLKVATSKLKEAERVYKLIN